MVTIISPFFLRLLILQNSTMMQWIQMINSPFQQPQPTTTTKGYGFDFKYVISKYIAVVLSMDISSASAFKMVQDPTGADSALVQVMDCTVWQQTINVTKYWLKSMKSYGITRPHWVDTVPVYAIPVLLSCCRIAYTHGKVMEVYSLLVQ